MRYLNLGEVVELHRSLLQMTGGASGIQDFAALESAVAQPKATFDGADLHLTIVDKDAAPRFSLVQGHRFVDGNKRAGHATSPSGFVSISGRSRSRCRPTLAITHGG